jgi:hypothetical protein
VAQPWRLPDEVTAAGWVVALTTVGATLFVLWQLRPGLIFANTTPTGVDLGGHVWGPAFLRSNLLPHLSGWTFQWFAGFPAYVFYMPLPALLVALFDVVFPYGVALKIVVSLGALALPVVVWGLARLSRLGSMVAALLPIAVLGFLFDDSWWRFGGNVRSDLTGEFSYAIALLLGLLTIGLADYVMRTGRWRALTAFVYGATLVSHPVVALLITAALIVLAIIHGFFDGWSSARRLLPVAAVGIALSAFWVVPFIAYRSELNNLNHPRNTGWVGLFFPLPGWAELIVLALAIVGVVAAVMRRRPVLITMAAVAIIAAFLVLVLPSGTFENGRALPFWHLGVWLLAGAGAAEVVHWLAARQSVSATAGPIIGLAVMVFVVGVNTGSLPGSTPSVERTPTGLVQRTSWLGTPSIETNIDPLWVRQGFSGYERTGVWFEYTALMKKLDAIGRSDGCGRAVPENDPNGVYGSPYEFALTPYWTHGCISSLNGIPEDMSRTYPFFAIASSTVSPQATNDQPGLPYQHFDLTKGVGMLRELGVRYYLAYSKQAIAAADNAPGLTKLATTHSWHIYRVEQAPLVSALTQAPAVVHGDQSKWLDAASAWFVARTSRPEPASGGPQAWTGSASDTLPAESVSHILVHGDRVSFHVDRIGVPVEVRASYFPWWVAQGASGPWRLGPNFMVVVPTSHEVTMTAKPRTPDHAGEIISLFGIIGLIALAVIDRLRRRRAAGTTDSAPTNEVVTEAVAAPQ